MNQRIKILLGLMVFLVWASWRAASRFEYRLKEYRAQQKAAAVGGVNRPPSEARKKAMLEGFEEGLQEGVDKNPLFLALRKYDPDYYERLLNSAREVGRAAVQENMPVERAIARVAEDALQMNDFETKYLPHASDEAVLAYAAIQINVWRQYLAKDTSLCFAALWGDTKEISERLKSFDKSITKETQDAVLRTKALVVESAMTKPQPVPDRDSTDKKLEEIGEELAKIHGNDVELLADDRSARRDRKKACELMIEFMDRATRLPKKDASAVLRAMFVDK
ncbi:MAG: hypothetical protein NT105_18200 [Verrucomicrobia bacterium]|nr:hypothetical protein [Verrucomicrobiota bacterium]